MFEYILVFIVVMFYWSALQYLDPLLLVCAKPKPFNSVFQGRGDLAQYHAK